MIHTDTAERIHAASLDLLNNPGIRLEHPGIIDLMLRHGAKAGIAADTVRIPAGLIDQALFTAPETVELADRRGNGRVIRPEGGRAAVWSVPGMNLGLADGSVRPFNSADMAAAARLLDHLPQVDGVFGLSMDDVSPQVRDVVGLRIMAENTAKHIRVLCFTPAGATMLREMRAVIGDCPWFSIGFTAHGPLRWTRLGLDIFANSAGCGIPVSLNGEPMAGVSGPVTLAGSAAVGNAEILAALVVNQLLEPGRPCIYNLGLAHIFDMRTSIAVTGAPENHLFAGLSAAMGRFYRLPSCSWVSTDSVCPDSQAALEKSIGFLTHMQQGVSLVWGVGQLESEMTFSPAQAVIDNEILAYSRRFLRGIETNDETLAVDTTRSVGIGGDYLATDHTLEHFRTELFEPDMLFRKRRPDWVAGGSHPLHQVAADRAAQLAQLTPVDAQLTEEQSASLRALEAHSGASG